jgi:hypothetical protein
VEQWKTYFDLFLFLIGVKIYFKFLDEMDIKNGGGEVEFCGNLKFGFFWW